MSAAGRFDPNVERGADTLAQSCLRVAQGERTKLLSYRADDVADPIEAGLVRAGAIVERTRLDHLADAPDQVPDAVTAALEGFPAPLRALVASQYTGPADATMLERAAIYHELISPFNYILFGQEQHEPSLIDEGLGRLRGYLKRIRSI